MTRLYDRLMRRPNALDLLQNKARSDVGLGFLSKQQAESIRDALQRSTVISADDVAHYWASTLGREWIWWHELPAVSLPLSPVFIEARYPGWPPGHEPFISDGPDQGEVLESPYAVGMLATMGELGEEPAAMIDPANPPRWWLRFLSFDEPTKGNPEPGLLADMYVNPDGTMHRKTSSEEIRPFWAHIDADGMIKLSARWMAPLMLAVSFAHCKNVVLPEVLPAPKVSRKAEKNYGTPLTRYRVLEIQGMREVLQSEGGVSEAGLKRALHICRGHFATYSPEKPLFGRYAGTFWKPQHVKGSKERGEVVKDYAVKAPK